MLKSSLCESSDPYILVKGTIIVVRAGADEAGRAADRKNCQSILKNYAPFTDCVNEIFNAQVDNVKDVYVVMLIYNLREYSDNYSKTSVS